MLRALIAWLRWKARRAQKSSFTPGVIKSIAIFELTRLGDLVTILPALRALRHQFPLTRIHIVVDVNYEPLIKLCEPEVNVVGVVDPSSVPGLIRALWIVRRLHPDLSCSMSPSNRNAILALACGSRFIVGYLSGAGTLTPFLGVTPVELIGFQEPGPALFSRENIQSRSLKVLQILGIRGPLDPGNLFDNLSTYPTLPGTLYSSHGGNGTPYIAIHPFSGWKYRSWPLDSFKVLALKILESCPHSIVFVCHVSEEKRLGSLRSAFDRERRVRFLSSNNILETVNVLHGADLFIGNDSGPLHLAALLHVPLVGLFGPASPDLTAPLSARGTFLYHQVTCSPCTQTTCSMPTNSCMSRITPDEALAAVKLELQDRRNVRGAVHG